MIQLQHTDTTQKCTHYKQNKLIGKLQISSTLMYVVHTW